jgi:hypothetical protein
MSGFSDMGYHEPTVFALALVLAFLAVIPEGNLLSLRVTVAWVGGHDPPSWDLFLMSVVEICACFCCCLSQRELTTEVGAPCLPVLETWDTTTAKREWRVAHL